MNLYKYNKFLQIAGELPAYSAGDYSGAEGQLTGGFVAEEPETLLIA